MPVVTAAATFRATSAGMIAKPLSKSAFTGTSTLAAIVRRWRTVSSSDTLLSRRPNDQANPELVVAIAGKPIWASTRAVPTSHGLGMTKHPLSWSKRNVSRRSGACLILRRSSSSCVKVHGILPTRKGSEVNEPLLRIDTNELHLNPLANLKVALAVRIQFAFDDRALQSDPGALQRCPGHDGIKDLADVMLKHEGPALLQEPSLEGARVRLRRELGSSVGRKRHDTRPALRHPDDATN
jgi:hypothetical protein